MQSQKAHAQALLVAGWSLGIPADVAVSGAVEDTGLSREEVMAIGLSLSRDGLEPEAQRVLDMLRMVGVPIKDPR